MNVLEFSAHTDLNLSLLGDKMGDISLNSMKLLDNVADEH